MILSTGRVLDRLPAEEPCLGAFFASYSFDPKFFEEHVLRAILRLTSDPVEQADRYHQEARRALQETPVVAVVDAGERQPGRRLPFDLLEVAEVVFHPKSVLLLYREHARMLIGSGNLTFSGYGGNTELYCCLELAYEISADAALLKRFDDHIGRVASLVRRQGTQLELFRDELRRRLPAAPTGNELGDLELLDSTQGPIMQQLVDLLPENATIERTGMLAPFFERDDASEPDTSSVFGALTSRLAKTAILEVGVAWENPQVHATALSNLEIGLDRIWSWAYEEGGNRKLAHLIPTGIGPNTLSCLDEAGQGRRHQLDEVLAAIEERELWQQPPPIAFAPDQTLRASSRIFAETILWLHPATRLVEGRPVHRPLHAKLLLIGFRSDQSAGTLVMCGSPNMSRRALLLPVGPGEGNAELAVAFRLDEELTLRDLVPELVYVPMATFQLQERVFPEVNHNWAIAIDEATHDPRERTLVVRWSEQAQDMTGWRLTAR